MRLLAACLLLSGAAALPHRRRRPTPASRPLRAAYPATLSTPTTSWPLPLSATAPGPACYAIPPTFAVTFAGPHTNDVTAAAATRYAQLFFAYGGAGAQAPPPSLPSLAGVTVTVTTGDGELRFGINESYQLSVWGGQAAITAPTAFGAVWALETLSQRIARKFEVGANGAINASYYALCDGNVTDAPRFPYRALLIDTARHFITVPAIKEVISMMSYLKMNGLHVHFTDTQSWPIFIPARPEISNVSAFSPLHVFQPADLKALVQYGRERGVVVYPEIDFPAHGDILTAVYPGMACYIPQGYTTLFNPQYPELWSILRDIYAAMDAIFPPTYPFHIGVSPCSSPIFARAPPRFGSTRTCPQYWPR